MQSFFVGVGAVVADMLPWMLKNWFHVSSETGSVNPIPPNVKISFYLGAAAFFCAVLWTVLTTKDYPPEDLEAFRRGKVERGGLAHLFTEIPDALRKMPGTMRRLALVQFFTWMGSFACGCTFPMRCQSSSAPAIRSRRCSRKVWNGRVFVTRRGTR